MQRRPAFRLILRRAPSTCAFGKLKHCVGARFEGCGGPWFETPRTRLRNLDSAKIVAPHHEAGRDHVCIKLTGAHLVNSDTRIVGPARYFRNSLTFPS